jgi:60 kDa SS-A/Ro ribonucleoprotein
MARTNQPVKSTLKTHEGAPARIINAEMQLRRSVMSCMLWENSFYENGQEISTRIRELVHACDPQKVGEIAVEARTKMKLLHVPLLLLRELARHKGISKMEHSLSFYIEQTIQRADELSELVSIYWKDGKEKLSAQTKKGLALAFRKFSEYDLAKYNQANAVKLRDVLFLCHAKPIDADQDLIWKRLINNELAIPDTWETNLSAGKDKKETWTRLLMEKKLGALALLRNLRNMETAGVERFVIENALNTMKVDRVLPFRFIAAARVMPQMEHMIEPQMLRCLVDREKLPGRTIILIDISGSMADPVSSKSDITRLDAACGVAILAREICEDVVVYKFNTGIAVVPPRRGFALRDAITFQSGGGTNLGDAVHTVQVKESFDRLIVITDEQSADRVPNPKVKRSYMINVASNKNGVGYAPWVHIDGFSEAVVDYIKTYEEELDHTVSMDK